MKTVLVLLGVGLLALALATVTADTQANFPSSGVWTWIAGKNTRDIVNQTTVTLMADEDDAPTYPRSRKDAFSWYVPSIQSAFIYGGGVNLDVTNNLSDMWRIDSNGDWHLMAQSPIIFSPHTTVSWFVEDTSEIWFYVTTDQRGIYVYSVMTDKWSKVLDGPDACDDHVREQDATFPYCVAEATGAFNQKNKVFYLFGGTFATLHHSNNLWKFDLLTMKWSWVSGGPHATASDSEIEAAGLPRNRSLSEAVYDIDSDTLWLFGGYFLTFDKVIKSEFFNDLWRYNALTNKWQHIVDTRMSAIRGGYWHDPIERALWLFFGANHYPEDNSTELASNEMWRLSLAEDEPKWMIFNNPSIKSPSYGAKGLPDVNNHPGGRWGAATWFNTTDRKLWLFGGLGLADDGLGLLNDMWRFDRGYRCPPTTYIYPHIKGAVQCVRCPTGFTSDAFDSHACYESSDSHHNVDPADENGDGLSTEAWIEIIVGSVLGALLLAGLIVFIVRSYRKKRATDPARARLRDEEVMYNQQQAR